MPPKKPSAKPAAKISATEQDHRDKLASESALTNLLLLASMVVLFPLLEMVWLGGAFFVIFYYANAYVRVFQLLYLTNLALVLDGAPDHSGGMVAKFFKNSKMNKWFRDLPFWSWAREYFNAELIKTVDLPPDKNYLFCYHPHGIISMGLQTSLGMDACGFSEMFPGIDRYVATLVASFKIPIFREWILCHGFVSCGSRTLKSILTTPREEGRCKSVVLVPGGANEALYTHPGEFKVHLKNRKGFIRVAIQTGASVVPVIGFGENELFYCIDNESAGVGQLVYKAQVFLMKKFSFSFPLLTRPIPRREKLVVVVGSPIATKKEAEPSQATIDRVHKEYCEQVEHIWNKHKDEYGKGIPFEIA